jgi:UAA transporter family
MSNTPNLTIPHVLSEFFPFPLTIPRHLFFLFINVITQYLCVRGVNRLTAISTALSIAIILNIRKFVSLALSVAVFGNKLATGVKIGALLVAVGAAWYAWEGRGRSHKRNRSNNIGLLSKPMEMPVLSTQVVQKESGVTPAIVATDLSSGNGSMTAAPVAELVDRKELGELHSGNSVKELDGKPRRRSITEGTG